MCNKYRYKNKIRKLINKGWVVGNALDFINQGANENSLITIEDLDKRYKEWINEQIHY